MNVFNYLYNLNLIIYMLLNNKKKNQNLKFIDYYIKKLYIYIYSNII